MTDDHADEPLSCPGCGSDTELSETIRTKPYGDLDPTRWQTLCCPICGHRLKTVFVGAHSSESRTAHRT